MPAGLQIFNDFGTVQIDENSETYVLHSKGTQVLNGRVYDSFSDMPESIKAPTRWVQYNTNGQNSPPGFGGNGSMLAFRPRIGAGTHAGVGWLPYNSLGFLGYNPDLASPSMLVDWWYFTRPGAQGSGAGLEIYRPDGSVAFSSRGGRPMKLAAVANDTSSAVNVPYAGDWAVCVGTPFPCVGDYIYDSSSQFKYQERGLVFQVGSTFVSNQSYVLGCRASYDSGQFNNGRNPQATSLLIDVSGL